jgi:Spy/CpxP family protein refolding chaperone
MKCVRALKQLLMLNLAMVLLVPAFTVAASQQNQVSQRCLTRWDILRFISDLNLTQEQKTTLQTIQADTKNVLEPLKAQAETMRIEMQEAFLAEQVDTVKADEQIAAIIALDGQIHDCILHAKLQATQILTPEQRAMILEKMQQVRECRENRRSQIKPGPEAANPDLFQMLLEKLSY